MENLQRSRMILGTKKDFGKSIFNTFHKLYVNNKIIIDENPGTIKEMAILNYDKENDNEIN